MPFEIIETIGRPSLQKGASMSYRRTTGRFGRSKQPKLMIFIPRRQAGNFDAKPGAKYVLQIGNGKDAGKARISAGAGAGFVIPVKHGFIFNFGFVPWLGEGAAEKEDIDIRLSPAASKSTFLDGSSRSRLNDKKENAAGA